MMKVLSRPDVAAFLRTQNSGARLAQLNYRAIQTASGIVLISVEGHQPSDMLRGGQAIEHLWLKAHELGLVWQPVTALIYLFEMLHTPSASIFNCCEQEALLHLQTRFERIFAPLPGHARLMLFKLSQADAPTARSLRLPLEQVLFYGEPQETLKEPSHV
jgi:nitroreductase